MTGTGDDDYQGSVALNSLTFLGCPVITMGITTLPDKDAHNGKLTEIIDPTRQSGVYRKLTLRDGKLLGAILVGDITFSGAYHRLIRENVEVSDLGSELLTGGRHFIQRLAELRRDEMEGDYSWRQHVWEEGPYRKKMNTHNWKRRTGQIEKG
jgi:NAD(P)H-nitrite reductase large subunit